MRWAKDIMRMEWDRAALKDFNADPFGQPRDRLKKRWVDYLDSDFSIIKI